MISNDYLNSIASRLFNDIDRVTINDIEGEILDVNLSWGTFIELTLRPIREISSLRVIKVYDKNGDLIYHKTTNVNIQDMYNIELKIRIVVKQVNQNV